ncbi:MAG: hydantoinase/oxoprolinase family protein [Reyranellaceae bacterium]
MTSPSAPGYRIGFDIGGTFTDLILVAPDGTAWSRKVLSSPANYVDAVVEGIAELLAASGTPAKAVSEAVHGTTIATNAILERRGASVALISTEGFRDVLEIGRLRMPGLFNLDYVRPAPLVPRRRRFEVRERMTNRGEVRLPLDGASLDQAIAKALASQVESIAVALIHAYANPAHERAIRDAIRRVRPDLPVTLSSDIHPEVGEFERTSTAVTNAYVMPLMEHYLGHLVERLGGIDVEAAPLIMQSNGGVMSLAGARSRPVLLIESGPAAGVVATAALARRIGRADVISVDIGGTTAKASVIEGGAMKRTGEFQIGGPVSEGSRLNNGGGFVIRAPAIDLAEVGAGGGSIVAVDAIGSLKVGPESAGAAPGPVCYGRGGERVTLTDANVCLGYLDSERLPSGLALDAPRARAAFEAQIADKLQLTLAEAAYGVFQVGCAAMARAIRAVTIERGLDPRAFTMVAFGGNGPLFAVAMARTLEIGTVIVPPVPGVFSAVGLLEADIERHFSRSFLRPLRELAPAEVVDAMARLQEEALTTLRAEGFDEGLDCQGSLDMKYEGQSFQLPVPFPRVADAKGILPALVEALGQEHEKQYGFRGNADAVQIVNLRATARLQRPVPPMAVRTDAAASVGGGRSRKAYFGRERGFLDTPVIGRAGLGPAPRPGPLLVEEYDATTLVPPGSSASLDEAGNIVIEIAGD